MMKQINKFIGPAIYSRISANTRLISLVNECLPIDVTTHIECIGINGQSLSLIADSPAKLSKLRFYTDMILIALHKNGFTELKNIKISSSITQGSPTRTPRKASKASTLSDRTCELIKSTAGTIENDRLRLALHRLADIGGKTPDC
jgi:hypothetical protein